MDNPIHRLFERHAKQPGDGADDRRDHQNRDGRFISAQKIAQNIAALAGPA